MIDTSHVQMITALARAQASAQDIPADEAPNEAAFMDALSFIGLLPDNIDIPVIWASYDAEYGFSWAAPGGMIEVAFRGDDLVRWAAREGEAVIGDDERFRVDGKRRIPPRLIATMDRVAP